VRKAERERERERARRRQQTQVVARKPARRTDVTRGLRSEWKWVLAGVVALHIVLALLALFPAPHTGGDNAGYLTLAKSLLERHEYRDLYLSIEPMHRQYPPGFPLILALASLIGITTWVQLKLMTIAFSALAIAFSYLWIRRRGRPELAAGVALLLAISPGVIELSHWELSDVPFWAMTMVALYAWQRLPDTLRGRFILAVVMTTLAYFTRSAGLPLLVAAFAWLGLHRRWKQLAILAAVIMPLGLLWYLRAKSQSGDGLPIDYAAQFWSVDPYKPELGRIGITGLVDRMGVNLGKYVGHHLPILLFGRAGLLPLSISITLLALYGWGVRIRRLRRAGVAEFFVPLYLGLILLWPAVWSGERFLLPALPFILFHAGDALVRLSRRVFRPAARLVPALASLVIVLLAVPAIAGQVEVGRECTRIYRAGDQYACLPDQYKDYYKIAELAPRLLPEDAAVVSRKPRSFYIIGGVPGTQYPLSADPDVFFREAALARTRYVVYDGLDGLSQTYLMPVLQNRSNAFCIMFSLGPNRASVLGIDLKAAAQPAGANAGDASFAECPASYWKSAAVKDSLFQGLIPLD
jgi:hypothetical protein